MNTRDKISDGLTPCLHGIFPNLKGDTVPVLALILLLSMVIRIAFFNGVFGSDDLVYLNRAVQISKGVWSSSNYNGALRYGFNIPAGFFIYLFGKNVFAANLWSLICSLAEIAIVYLFALKIWGRNAALYTGLILAFMPLHIAVATRIHSDPVVSCALTFCFIVFFMAEQYRNSGLYILTGICMGLVFWTKELATITLFPFIVYPIIWRKFDLRWAYVVGGGLVMLFAHFALMTFISGDPFNLFKVIIHKIGQGVIKEGDGDDSAWYYFKYLFLDIKHTWLAGILAFAALIKIVFARQKGKTISSSTAYVTFWFLSLIFFLSFMPISLSPLRFAMKQSNYISLFLAPMALLAGYFLAQLPRRTGIVLLLLTVIGGFFLSGMEQQAYRIFTSNSKAAVQFCLDHPGAIIFGSVNNRNIASEYATLNSNPDIENRFKSIGDMPKTAMPPTDWDKKTGYVILDKETMRWGTGAINLNSVPICWKKIENLAPVGFGIGMNLSEGLQFAIETTPDVLRKRLAPSIANILHPNIATVYQVPMSNFWCNRLLKNEAIFKTR